MSATCTNVCREGLGTPSRYLARTISWKASKLSLLLLLSLSCREVDGYNPYVEFQNGTFIPAQSAKFCSQDAQATQTSKLTDPLPFPSSSSCSRSSSCSSSSSPCAIKLADICELQHDRKHAVELDAISAHTIHMCDVASAFMVSRLKVAQQALQTLSGRVLTISVCTGPNSLHVQDLPGLMTRLCTCGCRTASQQPNRSCSCCSSQHDMS